MSLFQVETTKSRKCRIPSDVGSRQLKTSVYEDLCRVANNFFGLDRLEQLIIVLDPHRTVSVKRFDTRKAVYCFFFAVMSTGGCFARGCVVTGIPDSDVVDRPNQIVDIVCLGSLFVTSWTHIETNDREIHQHFKFLARTIAKLIDAEHQHIRKLPQRYCSFSFAENLAVRTLPAALRERLSLNEEFIHRFAHRDPLGRLFTVAVRKCFVRFVHGWLWFAVYEHRRCVLTQIPRQPLQNKNKFRGEKRLPKVAVKEESNGVTGSDVSVSTRASALAIPTWMSKGSRLSTAGAAAERRL